MVYHDKLRALLARIGDVDPNELGDEEYARPCTGAQLSSAEARLAVTLPASPREWYGREDAVTLLRYCSNEDFPLFPDEFSISEELHEGRQVLVFMHENQGVVEWGMSLGTGDDPAVVIRWTEPGEPWVSCAASFSDFVYALVFDWGLPRVAVDVYSDFHGPLPGDALDHLRSAFNPAPTTRDSEQIHHRFEEGERTVAVRCSAHQTVWEITAMSFDALDRTVEELARFMI